MQKKVQKYKKTDIKKDDRTIIENLIQHILDQDEENTVGSDSIKSLTRLGRKVDDKCRALRVTFETPEDKAKVMKKLYKLKQLQTE